MNMKPSILEQGTSCIAIDSGEARSPHKLTPMPGVHTSIKTTGNSVVAFSGDHCPPALFLSFASMDDLRNHFHISTIVEVWNSGFWVDLRDEVY
jgi:hypothetical protein